jgi:hypothetical protein
MKSAPKLAEETQYPTLQFDSHVTAYTNYLPQRLLETFEHFKTAERNDAEALRLRWRRSWALSRR